MKKVLHIMDASDGGISMVVLNYYRNIDREVVHFDIASTNPALGNNAEAMKKLGADIYILPLKSRGIKLYCKSIEALITEHGYDVVHVHENQTSYVALAIAKKLGVKKRIAHSHTSSPSKGIKDEIRRISGCALNSYFATDIVACGVLAGNRVFGKLNMNSKKAHILYNGIDTQQFKYSEAVGRELRDELHINNKFVIGMVGRLSEEKNYFFALDVIKQLPEEEFALVIAGDGNLRNQLNEYKTKCGLDKKVLFLGNRTDINKLYSAMDVFIMTSFHEGFPVVAVEAGASGLPICLSNKITDELKFYPNIKYLPTDDIGIWIDYIMSLKELPVDRLQIGECMARNNFDIRNTIGQLYRIYGI
ncbi:glycosyltransferase [Streptococcus uberis]|jgi:glycosyltransferase involved in cell wall biosynthesis|uniref:glycosyltransferase n=1 Tax=Streptococcus uberis TaxID=1349 RepID=UPI003D6C5260